MRLNLLRSIALPVVVTAGLLLLVLAIMLATTTRSLMRIEPLQSHLVVMQHLHEQILSLQYVSLRGLEHETQISHALLAKLNVGVSQLAQEPVLMAKDSHNLIAQARTALTDTQLPPARALHTSITLLHESLSAENRAHAALLTSLQDQAKLEMQLAAAALIAIPLAATLVLYMLRRRFLLPLSNLNFLLGHLADGAFVPARVDAVDPVLEPLFANYNQMVGQMEQLEAAQATHRQTLEAEVRAATRDLLAHNRSLAQAEKMASVGEMAAGVAHELRNPLAGIDLALANLRQELNAEDAAERIDLIRAELKRLGGLLSSLLASARQTPEAASPVALAQAIGEVLGLVRYQIPERIALESDIATDLACLLPEARLRQAILNLVLNAAQAMPEAGAIRVRAALVGQELALSVQDDGPGFSEIILREGILPFRSDRLGGSGLGLASVRRLVHDLGGTLRLSNTPTGGAQVTLLLPCITETNA